ncbi:hypothetical protein RC74_20515 [Falsihalocynthiibacter arcticus]|uniref:Transposase DDE domain-containing protein n=1 Tax=Falsihalocynthiibacter arcticus TaxID=1579316 RepID=A0A126V5S9_9RHOB|nr:hypothetical protein RC74_20515 [Falsihalocynthiibacter arcticus]
MAIAVMEGRRLFKSGVKVVRHARAIRKLVLMAQIRMGAIAETVGFARLERLQSGHCLSRG